MLVWLEKLYKKYQKIWWLVSLVIWVINQLKIQHFLFESILKSKTNIFYKKWNAFEIYNCLKVNFFIFVMMIFLWLFNFNDVNLLKI